MGPLHLWWRSTEDTPSSWKCYSEKKEIDLYIRNKQGSNAIMLAIDQEQQIQSFATFAIVQMFIFAKKI